MSPRLKVFLGFTIVCLLWGSSWAAVKIGLESIPPLLSLGIRFAIASTILGLIVILKHLVIPKEKKFWFLVLTMVLTSFTIPFVLIYFGQIRIASGLASVLFATYPLWVALVSHFLLPKEQITFVRIIGIVIGFLGVVFIFDNAFFSFSLSMVNGIVLIFVGAIIQAFGLVLLRRLGEHAHPITLNFCSMTLSALPLLAASYIFEDYSTIAFTVAAIESLFYLSLFCTVITFVIYFWLAKHVEAVILSLSAFITPVIAVLIGVIIMGEHITHRMYLGSALVLIGVAFASVGDLIALYRRGVKNGYE
jgi:drug/metabolite transporter (DMT)-like permease